MIKKKSLLFLILLPGFAFCAKEAFSDKAKLHHVHCSEDGAVPCEEELERAQSSLHTPYGAKLLAEKNGNRPNIIKDEFTRKITMKTKTQHHEHPNKQEIPKRKRSATQTQFSGGTTFVKVPYSGSNSTIESSQGPSRLKKRDFVSAQLKGVGKMSQHDLHLSETILSALKLILDKRNSFQNDSKALQLASVLLPRNDGKSHTKTARNPSHSGFPARRQPTRGIKFIIDLLSGANSTKNASWNARKSNIVANLVDPTELGISILKLLFGPKAPLVTTPKYQVLFNKIPATSKAQNVQRDSSNTGDHFPVLGSILGGRLEAKLRNAEARSTAQNTQITYFDPVRVGEMMKRKRKEPPRMVENPAKSYTDESGRRKSWVLLKIPKGESKGYKEVDGDLSVAGKMPAPATATEVPSNTPSKSSNLKNIAEDLSAPQHDDLDESSISSKYQNSNTDMQQDKSSKITAKLIKTVKKFLNALQSSIEALQSNRLVSSNHEVPNLEPKSSRPTARIPFMNVKPTTARLAASSAQSQNRRYQASNRERDPLRGVATQDEPITVPSAAAAGSRPALDDNVLFQSDTVIGTTRDTTDLTKLKEDLEVFAEKGLEAHNHFRNLHHAPNLRWSDDLANQAEKLAYAMAMKGTIMHSDAIKSLGEGENVAKISRVPFEEAGSTAAKVWYSEKANYSYSYPRLDEKNDAFTQIVWKSTKELGMGCAKDLQTNDMYVVALYRPAGNDKRLLRANVLKEGEVGRDVYATIFKKDRTEKPPD